MKKNTPSANRRAAYQPPRLTVFGGVLDLTAGGTGTSNEGSGAARVRP